MMSYKHITRDDIERSENTNTLNTQQWNLRENLKEKQQDGGVLQRGNAYNTRAYLGELSGKGERDEMQIISKEILKRFAKQGSNKGIKEGGKKVIKKEIKNDKKHKDQSDNSVIIENNSYKKGRPVNPKSTKTIPDKDDVKSIDNIRQGKNVSSEYPSYSGNVYEMPNGQRFGIRTNKQSRSKTETIDNMTKGSREKWKKGD